MPKFDNIPDTGKYEFEENLEVHEEFLERLDWVKRGMMWSNTLSKQQRKVVNLKLLDEMSFHDISKKLKLSNKTVYEHFKKALRKGAKYLQKTQTKKNL